MQNSRRKYLILLLLCFPVLLAGRQMEDDKTENKQTISLKINESERLISLNSPHTSLKSNALFLGGLVFNLGAEVKLSSQYSFDVIGYWSPYDMFSNNRKIRVLGIQPEIRYWWDEPLKSGHFIGLNGQILGFNIQLNDKYRYQDSNRPLWGMGLSYGYLLQLGKNSRWGVEFVLGVGYANYKYDMYEGTKNGKFIQSETHGYWGITRLGLDFCFRFNSNRTKYKKEQL